LTTSYGSDRGYDSGGSDIVEKVVQIRRVAKVVKGGRRLSFNAMVVVGDGKGGVGVGLGKGVAVPDAVRKGTAIAKKHMHHISLSGSTIPHAVRLRTSASEVIMKPAAPGVGIIAGGAVRAVMEAVGIKDVVAKALGSRNPINMVKATLAGLDKLKGGRGPEVAAAPEPVRPRPAQERPSVVAVERAAPEAVVAEPTAEPEAPKAVEEPVAEPTAKPEASEAVEKPVAEAVSIPDVAPTKEGETPSLSRPRRARAKQSEATGSDDEEMDDE
jgi:small subunit ribosomal protein S5